MTPATEVPYSGNAVFLRDRARRQRNAGLIGAIERNHLLFRDQAKRLVLPDRGAALVVGEYRFDLGAAEAGQTGVLRQRQITEFRVRVVDDVDRSLDRRLGVHAGTGGVAAQGKDRADLDGLVLGRSRSRQRNRKRGGAKQPEEMLEFHVKAPNVATQCQALNLRMSKDITPQLPVIIGTLSIACPVGRGKLRPAHRFRSDRRSDRIDRDARTQFQIRLRIPAA